MIKLQKKEEEKEEYNSSPDITLVRDSLEYYDKNNQIYKHKFSHVNFIRIQQNDNDYEHNIIHFYDVNKKHLFKSRFEYIGMHEPQLQLWSWAWSLSFLKKKSTTIIRKILNYGTELEPVAHFLKSELITSRFRIKHTMQLDIHNAIASYLSKKPVIYKFKFFNYPKFETNDKEEELINIINPDFTKNSTEEYVNYFLFLLDYEDLIKN
jgi:hypothetical protein